MAFRSILFERTDDGVINETLAAPACFVDLNLDQVVDGITAGRQEYDLAPFFYLPLNDVDAIGYRHEIMQELERGLLAERIDAFAQDMRTMRNRLAQADKLHYKYQKERWFLDAVGTYCGAVDNLARDLAAIDLKSRGLAALREYVQTYTVSEGFASLRAQTRQLQADLSAVTYALLIKGNHITIRRCESETDYSADVQATFRKFQQGSAKDYGVKFSDWPDMNHVEAGVLDRVARLYPDVFARLDGYCAGHADYLEETIARFDREIQFYLAYLGYIAPCRRAGLKFCYPRISTTCKAVHDRDGFDLALAHKLISDNAPVVCNDVHLTGEERVCVVSGPNQGGKTTFARMFGQLHYLASLGCPVPGRDAQLFLCDGICTHFERGENTKDLSGKLEDDLVRIHEILDRATSSSIIIMNEILTSTTLSDAIVLGKRVMEKILTLDSLCVCVTFIDELTALSGNIVSLVSTVMPDNPASRTFKIERRPADGLSYAISIAEKYRLTYHGLRGRITS